MLTKLFDISFEKVRADFVAAALVPSLTFVLVVTLLVSWLGYKTLLYSDRRDFYSWP
jgi:hypothetical protein